jgi:hypothetical protein
MYIARVDGSGYIVFVGRCCQRTTPDLELKFLIT